jgi:oligopeptide/dipeptide ABC transporter ATP-binding protein
MSSPATEERSLLSLQGVKVFFPVEKTLLDRVFSGGRVRYVHAVDGVDLQVGQGTTTGLVGESGSGKTTLGLSILGLVKLTGGSITFKDQNIAHLSTGDRRSILKYIQMVFQDPFSSLNPSMKVKEIVGRQFRLCVEKYSGQEIKERVEEIVSSVGLKKEDLHKYPHEFSGGQKQRISLARALAPQPELLIADEITSALDVSIQSQIIALLLEFRRATNLSMIYITHDLRVARLITDWVAVMYAGRIVEYARTADIFGQPLHPYTRALLSAIPRNDYRNKVALSGTLPSAIIKPLGCTLYERCPFKMSRCREEYPPLASISGDRLVACFLHPSR